MPHGWRRGRGFRRVWVGFVALLMVVWPALQPASPAAAETAPPVVLVHGLNSTAETWDEYLGNDGFLARIGRQGFAVGDDRAPGVLRTGSLSDPFSRTNTIAENAAVLAGYIDGVKERTGAAEVDIVAHSMGGLISRYYVDRLMGERDVGRLVMLGTPNGGSACAVLPASLGISTPATVELRPSYLDDVFNRQVNRRHGVEFHPLAGTAITNAIQSPCAEVPSDLMVSLTSVEAVGLAAHQVPESHTRLTGSAVVFRSLVAPALTREAPAAQELPPGPAADLQFAILASGLVPPGGTAEVVIDIDDDVAVASFGIYDPTRSLRVSVRGASGDQIELTFAETGLVTVDDPATLLHLGYGFERPAPGPWRVTLHATDDTPAEGAHYAVTAQVTGGATLRADTSELAPLVGQEVRLRALLERDGEPVAVRQAYAMVRDPDGREQEVTLTGETERTGTWRPEQPGLHSINVVTLGETTSGTAVSRVAFLVADVRSEASTGLASLAVRLGGMLLALVVVAAVVLVAVLTWRSRRSAPSA
jgi:pimeloyl-ACP methyl ester carboxylesterase